LTAMLILFSPTLLNGVTLLDPFYSICGQFDFHFEAVLTWGRFDWKSICFRAYSFVRVAISIDNASGKLHRFY
jgi:hypothetical protein